MDQQESGVNYILASSIENKDNELTLKNEVPKSEYTIKSNDMREGTLRNEPPLSEKSLRKDVPLVAREQPKPREMPQREAPKEEKPIESKREPEEVKEHKKINEEGNIEWNTTHFVFGVEAGSNLMFSY
jgi:hypothetical protein